MCFAWWALINRSKIHICLKFRMLSFWFYAVILLLLAISHTVINILYDLQEELLIVFATTDILLYLLILALDYHFCMVLKSYANNFPNTESSSSSSSSDLEEVDIEDPKH